MCSMMSIMHIYVQQTICANINNLKQYHYCFIQMLQKVYFNIKFNNAKIK